MGSSMPTSVVCLLICLTFATSGFLQYAASSTIEDVIPQCLVVPSGNEMQRLLFGTGSQIYNFNGTSWVLTNVSAELYNFKGILVGHHFFLGEKDSKGGQASWKTFYPASLVTGKAINNVAQGDSIPWLLLQVTGNSGSMKRFGSTTFVQRLYTQHGLPPSADYPAKIGDVFESEYSAVYTFSSKKS